MVELKRLKGLLLTAALEASDWLRCSLACSGCNTTLEPPRCVRSTDNRISTLRCQILLQTRGYGVFARADLHQDVLEIFQVGQRPVALSCHRLGYTIKLRSRSASVAESGHGSLVPAVVHAVDLSQLLRLLPCSQALTLRLVPAC
jgi:hypothetical protein